MGRGINNSCVKVQITHLVWSEIKHII